MSPRRRSSVPSRRRGGTPKRRIPATLPDPPERFRRLGIQPRKSLGQHFLIDEFILGDIAAACAPRGDETVLEIGAGPGVLTAELAERARRVVAVELDEELAAGTRERLRMHEHLQVVAADVLDFTPEELLAEGGAEPPYVACGNLPYYITQPIIRRLLEADPGPTRIIVLVQREVAQRIVGGPGHESMLSCSVKMYGTPRILFEVPSTAFWPPPKVQSAVIEIDRLPQPAVAIPRDQFERFFHLVHAGFAQPRKQLRNVIAEELAFDRAHIDRLLTDAGIDPVSRAQHLDLHDWERLYRVIEARHPEALDVR